MGAPSSQTYSGSVTNNANIVYPLLNGASGYVGFFITATDLLGNTATSPTQYIPLFNCIG
jgi:hypothetical protein